MKDKGHFKGRVVEINGTKITIDTKDETREFKDKATGETRIISSAWGKSDMPKISQVIRGIFKKED